MLRSNTTSGIKDGAKLRLRERVYRFQLDVPDRRCRALIRIESDVECLTSLRNDGSQSNRTR